MTPIGMKNTKRRDWSEAWDKVRDEAACRNCGDTQRLDPAHVIPRSLGGGMERDDVIVLCRACHDAQHEGRLELLPLLTPEEQVRAVQHVGIARAFRYLTLPPGGVIK